MATPSPWLGERRGALVDWVTQRWVQLTGRRVMLGDQSWLAGPTGSTLRIGPDYFETLGQELGLEVEDAARSEGLMDAFEALRGPGFDPDAVQAQVRHFYEATSAFELDVWSEWSGVFRPFGRLLARLFSRRLEQLNVPLTSLATSRGMASRVVCLRDPATGARRFTGWVRTNRATDETVYVGSYSIAQIPGHPAPCVKVVFPLPNGSATVVMRPSVEPEGSLRLESAGSAFGDPGFYFLVKDPRHEGSLWVRQLRTFRETIRVYVDRGELRTDHVFTLWRRPFLRLHYRMRERTAP